MTRSQTDPEAGDETQEDDISAVYGNQERDSGDLTQLTERHQKFSPWHHPVKQIVRSEQWAALTAKLLNDRPDGSPQILRYFTLPGEDLLDIKVLTETCTPFGVRIEYFGFNSGMAADGSESASTESKGRSANGAPWITAESALRQAGRVTPDAIIHSDRLEDIALENSHAATQLRQRAPFDIINIDACDHLVYAPKGRDRNTFDALQTLLQHQMSARNPWLLFLTTRVDPDLLGQPGINFQRAITQNLSVPDNGFGTALAACLGAEETKLATALNTTWNTHNIQFLKLYSVGLGKFLLQFFCGQPNLPANVELASVYAYRVHKDEPDMLALAFRITPDPLRVYPPSTGGAAAVPTLEPARAIRVAQRAAQLWDIDEALENDEDLRTEAITGIQNLLEWANYDIDAWRDWLSKHGRRPITLT
jgi:hypothetical protein